MKRKETLYFVRTVLSYKGRRPSMIHSSFMRRNKKLLFLCIALLIMLLLSACNGDPQTQQRADQSKITLDNALAHAQSIGVPDTLLQSIKQQETQLSATHAPLTLFSDQPATDYYTNLA